MVGSIYPNIMNVYPVCTWEPLAVCYLTQTAQKTPRTSLETTQRTNRTFFIMMLPFAGHEKIVFFFPLWTQHGGLGRRWSGGGSKLNHIRYMDIEKGRKKTLALATVVFH